MGFAESSGTAHALPDLVRWRTLRAVSIKIEVAVVVVVVVVAVVVAFEVG